MNIFQKKLKTIAQTYQVLFVFILIVVIGVGALTPAHNVYGGSLTNNQSNTSNQVPITALAVGFSGLPTATDGGGNWYVNSNVGGSVETNINYIDQNGNPLLGSTSPARGSVPVTNGSYTQAYTYAATGVNIGAYVPSLTPSTMDVKYTTNDPTYTGAWRSGDDRYADSVTVQGVDALGHNITTTLGAPKVVNGVVIINGLTCTLCQITFNFVQAESSSATADNGFISGGLVVNPRIQAVKKATAAEPTQTTLNPYIVKYRHLNAWAGNVVLSIAGLTAPGATPSFNGGAATVTFAAQSDPSYELKFTVNQSTPVGSYPFKVVATEQGGTQSYEINAMLVVGDFDDKDDAKFLGYYNEPPTTMQPGETRDVVVFMQNTGLSHWKKKSGSADTDGFSLQQWNSDTNTGQNPSWNVQSIASGWPASVSDTFGYNGKLTEYGYKINSDAGPYSLSPAFTQGVGNITFTNPGCLSSACGAQLGSAGYMLSELLILDTNGNIITPVSASYEKYGDCSGTRCFPSQDASAKIIELMDNDLNTGISYPSMNGENLIVNLGAGYNISNVYAKYNLDSGYITGTPMSERDGQIQNPNQITYNGQVNMSTGALQFGNPAGSGYADRVMTLINAAGNPIGNTPVKPFSSYRVDTTFKASQGQALSYAPGYVRLINSGNNDKNNSGMPRAYKFRITAPTLTGDYKFQWRMYRDGEGFFGEPSRGIMVRVDGAVKPDVNVQVSRDKTTWAKGMTIFKNDPIFVKWDVVDADSCTASWGGAAAIPTGTADRTADSSSIGTKTYTVTCTKGSQTTTSSGEVQVVDIPAALQCAMEIGNNQMKGCAVAIPNSMPLPPNPFSNTLFYDKDVTAFPAAPYVGVVPATATIMDQNIAPSDVSGMSTKYIVRWKGEFNFSPGGYKFTAGSDDGAGVIIYDRSTTTTQTIIDDWDTHPNAYGTRESGIIDLSGKKVVEFYYYQNTGTAKASLSWRKVSPPPHIGLSPATFTFNGVVGQATPTPQTLTISNTGAVDLLWTAKTNQTWCRVNGVNSANKNLAGQATTSPTGTTAPLGGSTVSVSVDSRSVPGTVNCNVIITDPLADNSPTSSAVTYNVLYGSPSNVTTSNANGAGTCSPIKLTWTAGSGNPTQYNIYRNTSNSIPGAALATTAGGVLTYTDSTADPDTRYYYWVESVGGDGTKVAASSNGSGGVVQRPCAPTSATATVIGICEKAKFNWADVDGEDGYHIYRNVANNFAGAGGPIDTEGPGDGNNVENNMPSGTYYFWITAFNSGGDGPARQFSPAPIAIANCASDLSISDKDITSIAQANNTVSISSSPCGGVNGYDPMPPTITPKSGDTVTFAINMCNSLPFEDATGIRIVDTMENMNKPATGWQARYQDTSGAWQNINPSENLTNPNSPILTFNFPGSFSIPKKSGGLATVRILEFKAVTAPISNKVSVQNFMNKARIYYKAKPTSPAFSSWADVLTGYIKYYNSLVQTPTRFETQPQ